MNSRRFAACALAVTLASCASREEQPAKTGPAKPVPISVDPAELRTIQELEDIRVADDRLTRLLRHDRPIVRQRALTALGRIADPATLPAVAAALIDPEDKVVQEALWALGQIGTPGIVAEVRRFLEDPVPARRALAIEAISRTRQPDLASLVARGATDASALVRGEVGMALWRLSEGERSDIDRATIKDAVRGLGPLLSDPDTRVRWRTALACARLDSSDLAGPLERSSNDPDGLVRLFSIRALGKNPAAPLAPFVRTARDADTRVVIESVQVLARRSDPEAITALEAAATSGESASIALAVESLGSRKKASANILRMASRHPSPSVRGAAIVAMANQHGAAKLEEVRAALRSPAIQVRRAAVRALVEIGTVTAEADLEAILAGGAKDLQLPVIDALMAWFEVHPGELARWDRLLQKGLGVNDLAVRGSVVELLKGRVDASWEVPLRGAYGDSGADPGMAEVRAGILLRLAELKVGEDLARPALEDPSYPVREAAAAVIQACTGEGVVPAPEKRPELSATPWEELPYHATVRLETTQGVIRIRLLSGVAPVHAWTIARLVKEGFYDGKSWHRVVPNFVVQGGDPRGDGWGDAGFALRDELSREPYEAGTVGMAKAGKDTGSCQLFISTVPTPHLDGRYTVFGRVVEGLEVARALEAGDEIRKATLEK